MSDYIVDVVTGEVVERENKNQVIEKKLAEVGAISENTFEILESYRYYEEQFKTIKYVLKKAMTENGIDKWDNNLFVTYISKGGMQKQIDSERMKDTNIYDYVMKWNKVFEGLSESEIAKYKDVTIYDEFTKLRSTEDKLTIKFKEKR